MQSKKNAPIGIFDSGVGGLTVAEEVMRQLPNEKIVYFGDTARVPYGSKSKDTIIKFSRQIIRYLRTWEVKAIVVACNTASALALPEIQKELDIPIVGVIEPGAKVAAEISKNGRIGIIGTEGTINSHIHTKLIKEVKPSYKITEKACPLFVPLVEEGFFLDTDVAYEIAGKYLEVMKDRDVDTLILGCTHYPFLRETIKNIMGAGVSLVNPAYETARELKKMLEGLGIEADEVAHGDMHRFCVSDGADKVARFAKERFPFPVNNVTQINIEEY
ncbi:MAG: glutamate racemase [Lachnospiraceae bacterium]|nr:glutamate racemase [Lachnospiraceae bacterium]